MGVFAVASLVYMLLSGVLELEPSIILSVFCAYTGILVYNVHIAVGRWWHVIIDVRESVKCQEFSLSVLSEETCTAALKP